MKKFKKSFTVVRSNWYRGLTGAGSKLLNERGEQCCVGFYSSACGFNNGNIRGMGSVSELVDLKLPDQINIGRDQRQYDPFIDAYRINDNPNLKDDERERLLTEWFAERDIEILFVD